MGRHTVIIIIDPESVAVVLAVHGKRTRPRPHPSCIRCWCFAAVWWFALFCVHAKRKLPMLCTVCDRGRARPFVCGPPQRGEREGERERTKDGQPPGGGTLWGESQGREPNAHHQKPHQGHHQNLPKQRATHASSSHIQQRFFGACRGRRVARTRGGVTPSSSETPPRTRRDQRLPSRGPVCPLW